MDAYLLAKTLHIVTSTILFGTGIGTAFHMYVTYLRGDVRAIAMTAKNVVLADWLFIAPAAVIQPLSGAALIAIGGFDPWAPWLVVSYAVFILAIGCWLAVVRLQIRLAAIAGRCARNEAPLPPDYQAIMRVWFWLGWPALVGLIIIFWLMAAKPALW
jgi:uncharacterized membrane protein